MRRTGIKPISEKRQKQKLIELDIKRRIYELGNGLCELCKVHPISDMGHEILFRSRCGSPIDPWNVAQLCLRCHTKQHGLISGEKPIEPSILLAIIKTIRKRQGFIPT